MKALNVSKLISPEIVILFSLRHGPRTVYDIAIKTGYARSTIYYNVRKLQAQGLVEEHNGTLRLTARGHEIVEQIREIICEGEN